MLSPGNGRSRLLALLTHQLDKVELSPPRYLRPHCARLLAVCIALSINAADSLINSSRKSTSHFCKVGGYVRQRGGRRVRTISQRSKKRPAEGDGYDNVQSRPHRGSPGCPDRIRASLADKPRLGGFPYPSQSVPVSRTRFTPSRLPFLRPLCPISGTIQVSGDL